MIPHLTNVLRSSALCAYFDHTFKGSETDIPQPCNLKKNQNPAIYYAGSLSL